MSVDNVEAVVERGCGGGGGGGGKGEEAAGVTATWRHHRSISTASNMSVLLLFLLCLAPCLASAMTNPDSLTLGLQCDFERQEECGWEWQTDIPDTPFRITTGRELEQQISQQVPGERLSGVLYDASQNPDGQFLYLGVPEEGGDLLNNTRLIKSPWMEESVEECKLEADYNVKDLDTTIKVIIENGNYTRFFTIDSVRTDKASAVWKRVSSTIGHLPKKFRLGIEVLLSHRRPTHAAIDNIKLVNCFESVKPPGSPCYGLVCENGKCLNKDSFCDITKNCPGGEDEAMCDELPMGSRCNFEDGWCGWKNIEGDNMDFIRSRGPTTKERTGPGHDHTFKNDSGHYLLSELPTKGKLGDHGVLESPFFESPPCYHSNQTSPYFESCKLRLYYHKLGRYQGSLILKVFEYDMRGTREDPPHILTQIHGEKGTEWVRIVLPLPKDMYKRYKIQISNVRGSRFRGDLGIDDVTLSPECFGRNVPPEELKCPIRPTPGAPTPGPSDSPTTYVPPDGVVMVTTCGALGHKGPAPENCREEYHSNPGQAPTVPSSTSLPGTQIWKVPHDGYYTIVAKGASGGSGVQSQDLRTHGAIARATFLLTATTELYILVGQEGMSACRNVPNETREQRAMCASKKDPPVASNQSKSNLENLKMKINSHTVGGGGGGSFVFMMDNGTPKALVVGGGAAGLAWAVGEGVTSIQDGQNMNTSLPESHGHALHNGALYYAGPGGGWEGIRREQEGQSLMNGGVGGRPCNYPSGFLSTFGGFGGGGGGCLAGGGGGGYTGGNAYSGPERHGEGGFSYTASIATFSDIRLGLHLGPGVVFIIPATKGDCGCDHMCMPLDEHLRERKCLCEQDQVLSDDDKTCVPASGDSYMQTLYVAFIVLGALVVALISATSIYCSHLVCNPSRRPHHHHHHRRRHSRDAPPATLPLSGWGWKPSGGSDIRPGRLILEDQEDIY